MQEKYKDLDNKSYLQAPFDFMDIHDGYNLMCCCCRNDSHHEAEKLTIVNDTNDSVLNKRVFDDRLEIGKPEVKKPINRSIKGLSDERRDIFHRKEDMMEILTFLLQKKTILIVSGPKGICKLNTVSKAIQFAAEHEFEAIEDGAYLIDMKGFTSISQVY